MVGYGTRYAFGGVGLRNRRAWCLPMQREREREREVVEIADQTVHAIVFDNRLIGCSLHPYSTVSPLIL
ncbi:hypothetical protein ANTPLA_LOCUS5522 [Anthophora plagiata]